MWNASIYRRSTLGAVKQTVAEWMDNVSCLVQSWFHKNTTRPNSHSLSIIPRSARPNHHHQTRPCSALHTFPWTSLYHPTEGRRRSAPTATESTSNTEQRSLVLYWQNCPSGSNTICPRSVRFGRSVRSLRVWLLPGFSGNVAFSRSLR
jgi:hypothetical protein